MPIKFPFHRGAEPAPAPPPKSRPTVAELHPQFAPFASAVAGGDWRAIRRLFDDLPADIDPTWAVEAAAEVDGSERFLGNLVRAERKSSLPRLLLGSRYVKLAWQARTSARARYVSADQFKTFFAYLGKAEKFLNSVTTDEPDNVAAWSERITTARGLELGHDEGRHRYAMAARAFPHPIYAQRQLLQSLCPKWSGKTEEVRAFARECADAAPAGAINASLIAEAHLEEAFEMPSGERVAFLRQPWVVEDLIYAADRSVSHPTFRQVPGWAQANCEFAYAFRFSGEYERAVPLFRANGDLVTYPWINLFKEPAQAWQTARDYCEQHS